MTTNSPPIAAWAPSTALHKLASRHNNAPCVLTDGPAEFNDVALIRLSDYEALQAELADTERDYLTIIEAQDAEHRKQLARLQAECEEELFCVRQTRDTHFGDMMRAIEQVDALKAECERWKRGSEIRDEQNQDLHSFIMELRDECEKLRNLLRHAQPIIRAHAGASHMLDGFRPKRNQWDELVEGIDAAIQEENRGR